MNGLLGHDSALSSYTAPGATWANVGINHALGAGSIIRPVDLQS